jgi:hypothetical protein
MLDALVSNSATEYYMAFARQQLECFCCIRAVESMRAGRGKQASIQPLGSATSNKQSELMGITPNLLRRRANPVCLVIQQLL